ncbi:helix-turn-helix domain-containing protein [Limibacter armeniacum]|uniref:helix-turn-helix domain-containing protein n=1 Tax=Limibacter armeniacum TaxID=466084 RepID=UPI002FE56DA2
MSHLNLSQRKKIYEGIEHGKSNAAIARELGVHRCTVGREIKRNGGSREQYDYKQAERMARFEQRYASRMLRNSKGKGRKQRTIFRYRGSVVATVKSYYQYDSRRRICRKQDEKISRYGQAWCGPVWRWNKTDNRWARRRKYVWRSFVTQLFLLQTYMAEKISKGIIAQSSEAMLDQAASGVSQKQKHVHLSMNSKHWHITSKAIA